MLEIPSFSSLNRLILRQRCSISTPVAVQLCCFRNLAGASAARSRGRNLNTMLVWAAGARQPRSRHLPSLWTLSRWRKTSPVLFLTQQKCRLKQTKNNLRSRSEEMLRENVLTVPNALCLARIAASPLLAYLVVSEAYTPALGLFLCAGVTDLLDGAIARRFPSQRSAFGSYFDPLADKFLVSCLFVSLTYSGLIPVPLTVLIVGRDVLLIGASFYVRFVTLPPPKTLSRYFDVTQSSARLNPTPISKFNTAVQLSLVASSLCAPVFGFVEHPALIALWYLTAASTVASGLSYVFSKNTVEILSKRKN